LFTTCEVWGYRPDWGAALLPLCEALNFFTLAIGTPRTREGQARNVTLAARLSILTASWIFAQVFARIITENNLASQACLAGIAIAAWLIVAATAVRTYSTSFQVTTISIKGMSQTSSMLCHPYSIKTHVSCV
jgi:hypothetical protein